VDHREIFLEGNFPELAALAESGVIYQDFDRTDQIGGVEDVLGGVWLFEVRRDEMNFHVVLGSKLLGDPFEF
jgi:hypothetical protein